MAAIVGLQNLALSIDDTVTRDIQVTHQADIVVSVDDRGLGGGFNTFSGVSEDLIEALASSTFTSKELAGLASLATDDGWVDSTFSYVANPDRPSFIAPAAGPNSGNTWFLQPYLIEGDKYPLYGELLSIDPKNVPLAELLNTPGEIVLSQDLADKLGVGIGEKVELENSSTFQVSGIVSNQAAGSPLFAPVFVPPIPVFAYMDLDDPVARGAFGLSPGDANVLFIKTRTTEDAERIAGTHQPDPPERREIATVDTGIRGLFFGSRVETAEEALPEIEDATDFLGKFLVVAGLVSLSIGGIGILNTMLVVVGRRTIEVGILKSLGLKARQILTLFIIEGVVMGVGGSISGVLLGILLSFVLIGVGEQFLQSDIEWGVQLQPVIVGLVVGAIVTTVFGFLPILAASRVRPNVVLQSQTSGLPRTGRLTSILVVLALTAIMGVVVSVFVDNFLIGLLGTFGTMAVLAVLTILLLVVVWATGKLPDLGSIILKISLRGLSRQKGRAAMTLLALVVGLSAMGAIVIIGDSMDQFVDGFLEDELGGNLFVILPDPDLRVRDRVVEEISSLPNVTNSVESHEFAGAELVAINGAPLGSQREEDARLQPVRFTSNLVARRGTPISDPPKIGEGRGITSQDLAEGRPVVVAASDPDFFTIPIVANASIGNQLTFSIDGQEVDFELIGKTVDGEEPVKGGFAEGRFLVPLGGIPEDIIPSSITFSVTVPESEASAAAQQMNRNLAGAVVLELDAIANLFKEILDRVAVLPSVLSALALFTGAVIIANSVALATMERRREIALMKTVGAKANRILAALLIENGILGMVGGTIAVVFSILLLVLFHQFESDAPISPDPLSILLVLVIGVGVAIGAATISALPASRERPLEVLRYE